MDSDNVLIKNRGLGMLLSSMGGSKNTGGKAESLPSSGGYNAPTKPNVSRVNEFKTNNHRSGNNQGFDLTSQEFSGWGDIAGGGPSHSEDTRMDSHNTSGQGGWSKDSQDDDAQYGQENINGWADIKAYNDNNDREWFDAESKRLAELYGGDFINAKYLESQPGRVGYYCQLCNAEMNARKSLDLHCRGMKHLKRKDLWEKGELEKVEVGENRGSYREKNPGPPPAPPGGRDKSPRPPRGGRSKSPRPPYGARSRSPRPPYGARSRSPRPPYRGRSRSPLPPYRGVRSRSPHPPRGGRSRSPFPPYGGRDRSPPPHSWPDRGNPRRDCRPLRGPSPPSYRDDYGRLPEYRHEDYHRADPSGHRSPYGRGADRYGKGSPEYGRHGGSSRREDDNRHGGDRHTQYPRREAPPPPVISAPVPPKSELANKLFEGISDGSCSELLKKLSVCRVKNAEDSALATNVASFLIASLREYFNKVGPPTVVHVLDEISIKMNIMKELKKQ